MGKLIYALLHAVGNVHDDNKTRASRFDDFKFRGQLVQIHGPVLVKRKVRVPHDDRPGADSTAHGVVFVRSLRPVRMEVAVLAEMNHLEI